MNAAFQAFIAIYCNPNWNNRTNEKMQTSLYKKIPAKPGFFCGSYQPPWGFQDDTPCCHPGGSPQDDR